MKPVRIEPGPGQESVWAYPRPPRTEDFRKRIKVIFNGVTIADTVRSRRILETSHPPVYYIPPEDIRMECLHESDKESFCEWKGTARYYHVVVNQAEAENAAWYYPDPSPEYAGVKNHVAFYASPMDACFVDGEMAIPQPGNFYGGWITKNIVGPFKGEPGSRGW